MLILCSDSIYLIYFDILNIRHPKALRINNFLKKRTSINLNIHLKIVTLVTVR